jgi:hypothetical protein
MRKFALNDWIIHSRQETSNHPEPGAHHVHPSTRGDSYSYMTDELWQIVRVNPDGTASAIGPDGTVHHVRAYDPHVHKASRWRRRQMRRRLHRRKPVL